MHFSQVWNLNASGPRICHNEECRNGTVTILYDSSSCSWRRLNPLHRQSSTFATILSQVQSSAPWSVLNKTRAMVPCIPKPPSSWKCLRTPHFFLQLWIIYFNKTRVWIIRLYIYRCKYDGVQKAVPIYISWESDPWHQVILEPDA